MSAAKYNIAKNINMSPAKYNLPKISICLQVKYIDKKIPITPQQNTLTRVFISALYFVYLLLWILQRTKIAPLIVHSWIPIVNCTTYWKQQKNGLRQARRKQREENVSTALLCHLLWATCNDFWYPRILATCEFKRIFDTVFVDLTRRVFH